MMASPRGRRVVTLLRTMRSLAGSRVRLSVQPGHYYSPIADLREVRLHEAEIFAVPTELAGLDLRTKEQLALVDELARYASEIPFKSTPQPGVRYYFDNDQLRHGDAITLYSMLRHLRPCRIVEVGSGFSSAAMLDTIDHDPALAGVQCTFIDPDPSRLSLLLTDADHGRHRVITESVQNTDLTVFSDLASGDILFIDSSHVAKVGSDVNHLFFRVLPALPSGVHVHIHDIFWPFEYPREWVYDGRAWTEAYLAQAFLMFNAAFRIELFNSYLAAQHRRRVADQLPLWDVNPGGSLWVRRV
jgi:predicted O-methyltransferase YrrM